MDNFQLEIVALHKEISELRIEVSHLQQATGVSTIVESFKDAHYFRVSTNPNADNSESAWIIQIYKSGQGNQDGEPIDIIGFNRRK